MTAQRPRDWIGDAAFPWPAVATLSDGDAVSACFHLDAVELLRTKHDKPYLRLRLSDRHGALEARVWEDAERMAGGLEPGRFVGVRGRVQIFRNEHQLKVEDLAELRVEGEDLGLFLPRSDRDFDEMDAELRAAVASVADAPLRALLDRLLGPDTETGRLFRQAPAAKFNHHACIGGLMAHTLSMVKVCDFLAWHYGERVDRDLLVAGALLHDFGKIREIAAEAGFPYTDEGKLLGHIIVAIQMVTAAAESVPGLERERLNLLLHLIASHQGKYEWQSPREPHTMEALILHHVDYMDAKVEQALNLLANVDGTGWTAYDRSLGRDLLRHDRGVEGGDQTFGVPELDAAWEVGGETPAFGEPNEPAAADEASTTPVDPNSTASEMPDDRETSSAREPAPAAPAQPMAAERASNGDDAISEPAADPESSDHDESADPADRQAELLDLFDPDRRDR